MTVSRYSRSQKLGFGTFTSASTCSPVIRQAITNGTIDYKQIVSRQGDRLDTLAGQYYGDGQYWWIIAAASGIGWGLQMAPDTLLNVPALDQVLQLIG